MPRDVKEGQNPIDRLLWISKMEKKAPVRRAVRTRVKPSEIRGTLGAKRNFRLVIREAALRRSMVIITYKKTTTNTTNQYLVEPYSYRTRKLKIGRRKVLYAFDTHKLTNTDPKRSKSEQERSKKPSIKSFAMSNIHKAVLTDKKYTPRWTVEIK
jgi:hypothetical protein